MVGDLKVMPSSLSFNMLGGHILNRWELALLYGF